MVFAALPCVDLQKGPDPPAHGAATLHLDLAGGAVLEEVLHLLAVRRRAGRVLAARCVGEELHVEADRVLALLALLFREVAAAFTRNSDLPQLGVFVGNVLPLLHVLLDARAADVEVWAFGAVVSDPAVDVHATDAAGRQELGNVRVVHVVESHHRCMFGASKGVELIVVALAQVQEGLSGIEEVALDLVIEVFCLIHRNQRLLCCGFLLRSRSGRGTAFGLAVLGTASGLAVLGTGFSLHIHRCGGRSPSRRWVTGWLRGRRAPVGTGCRWCSRGGFRGHRRSTGVGNRWRLRGRRCCCCRRYRWCGIRRRCCHRCWSWHGCGFRIHWSRGGGYGWCRSRCCSRCGSCTVVGCGRCIPGRRGGFAVLQLDFLGWRLG
mmetsp:Transcript_14899/g.44133  ORF Transcript_14899/g.44133 Transcript_14899/m.44133 type:complete len:378 (-) Transcript_14899:341-1474(-)